MFQTMLLQDSSGWCQGANLQSVAAIEAPAGRKLMEHNRICV